MTGAPTILSCLREIVRQFPDRPAVSDAERTLTYRELWLEAERYAAQLDGERGEGCEKGENRANFVEAIASVDFAVAAVGTYLSGRVFVPFAKNAPVAVIQRIKKETDADFGPDVADILYTTGTTGASKGVILSHRAVWASADNNRYFDRITEATVYLIASPLDHVSALRKLYACFLVGAHAVLQDGFLDVRRYYETIERHRVNALLLPPSAVAFLLRVSRNRLQALDGQIKVVHSNGAPMSEASKEALRQCLPHARLVFAYGATEAGSVCCAYDYDEFPGRANCVGKPGPHSKITIEDGCIVVSGDGMMDGYLGEGRSKSEKGKSKNFQNSKPPSLQTSTPVHHTHDLGRIDDDGFVYVIGRADDIINVGGMKVSPAEVEEVATRYPEIVDCACFGIDDPLTGSAVKLNVVPRDASRFDLVDFRRFLQECLERHQLPSQIACVMEIPKTQNGKIDRKLLA